MILWIVLCIETTRQIVDVQNRLGSRGAGRITNNNAVGNGDPEKRFLTSLYSQLQIQGLSPSSSSSASITPMITRSILPRLFILAIFNTFIEELIAFIAIISLMLNGKHCYDNDNGHHSRSQRSSSSNKWFRTSITLLTIIWFIEQYRIGDLIYYHHNFDYQQTTTTVDQWNVQHMILTAHIIHFIIIIIGGMICLCCTMKTTKTFKTMTATMNTNNNGINTIHNDRLLSTSSSTTTTTASSSSSSNVMDIEANRLQSKQHKQLMKQKEQRRKKQSNNLTFKSNYSQNNEQQMDLNGLQPTTSTANGNVVTTNGSSIKMIGDRFKKPCHWMRSTFIIHNNGKDDRLKNAKNKSKTINSIDKSSSNIMAINDQNNDNDSNNNDDHHIDNDVVNQGRGSESSTATASTTIAMDRLIE